MAALCASGAEKSALDEHLDAARKARTQRHYDEAEREGAAAVAEGEKLGALSRKLNAALSDLAYTYFTQGKYAQAEPLYFRASETAEAAEANATERGMQLQFLGYCRMRMRQPQAALEPLERALAILESAVGPDHPRVGSVLADLASAQAALLKRPQAEASLRRALKIQDKLIGPDRARTAATMMQLGYVLDGEGKFDEAAEMYRGALKIREGVFGPVHGLVADSLDSLAELLRLQGHSAEAEPLYRREVEISEKVYRPDDLRLARSLNNLSLAARDLRRYDEAETLLLRAIDIAGKSDGPEQRSVSRFIGNLAVLYRLQQRLEAAEKMATRALAIRETTFGKNSPELVYELQNVADVYTAQNRLADAEPLCRHALTIEENNVGPNHPNVSRACFRLAANLAAQRKLPEAEGFYRRALDIVEKHYGPQSRETASAFETLARFYYSRAARFSEADQYYQRALALREKAVPEGAARLATLRNNYGVFLRAEGKYKDALHYLELAYNAPAVGGGGMVVGEGGAGADQSQPTQSSAVLENLGDLYGRLGYYAKAEPLLMKAMDSTGDSDTEAAAVVKLRRLSQIDYNRQRYSHALPLLEQALALSEKSKIPETRAAILEEIANVKRESRQFAEAAKLYNEALIIRERDTPDQPALGQLLDNIGVLAIRQNRLPEAEPALLRARRIYERTLNFDNAFDGLCMSHLAMAYSAQQRFAEAEPLFKSSLDRLEKSMGPDVPALAPVLHEYAQLCRRRNRVGEAATLEARARKAAQNAEAVSVEVKK